MYGPFFTLLAICYPDSVTTWLPCRASDRERSGAAMPSSCGASSRLPCCPTCPRRCGRREYDHRADDPLDSSLLRAPSDACQAIAICPPCRETSARALRSRQHRPSRDRVRAPGAFLSIACRACNLSALAGLELDVVHVCTKRDLTQRNSVADPRI